MRKIGFIDAEGGPLLLIDAADRRKWRGVDGDDYDRACDLLDKSADKEGLCIDLDDVTGLLWEIAGSGTVHVLSDNSNNFYFIRAWLSVDGLRNENAALASFMNLSADRISIGRLDVKSGVMIALWAPENAAGLDLKFGPDEIQVTGDLSIENAAIAFVAENGIYNFEHINVSNEFGHARCLLFKKI